MSERNPWELLHYRLKSTRLNYSVDPPILTNLSLKKRFPGKSDARAELILCTLCNSIILLSRLAEHFRVRHKKISTPSADLCPAVFTSNSDSECSLSSKHSEDLCSYSSSSTNLGPSDTYRQDMLQECFPQSWNHDDDREQTPRLFNVSDSFKSVNNDSNIEIPVDVPPSIDEVDNVKIEDGNNTSTPPDFFDFYDIFPDASELYDDTNAGNNGVSTTITNNNDIDFADLKNSNVYFNDLLHSTQGGEIGKTSTVVPHHDQTVTQPMNTYLSTLNESESYLTVGRSETFDCHSHTLETPSPDFFTLPSASSSSTYSVDSSVFNNTDAASSQCLNTCFPDQSVYAKNYEIKSPPTVMPILVRFSNTTPARIHGENDVEVEQAVASIVNLDEQPTDKKISENKSAPGQPRDEQKVDEKLPVLSPMDTVANGVPDHSASNAWVENTAVGGGTSDIDWEIWDSLELPACDYIEGDTSESLPLLKPNDLVSSLESYLPESNESQTPFEMSVPLEACQLHQQQQQQREQQREQTQVTQTVFPVKQSVVVAVTTSEQQIVKPTSSATDSKPTKGENSSRSRRSMDCLNGSLPLHLWPFDPRLHCGVQRDGTVCRRSLLCKLHSMGLKRQVERPQDIGLLVKQLREAKRLKKLSFPKPENSEAITIERKSGSSAFILPNTSLAASVHPSDALRSKADHHSVADGGFKYISSATPIKPAIEVAQPQTLGGISTNAATVGAAAAATPALLRCAYTGNQLQISTGLLSNHGGLQIVEKSLHLQSAAFPQATGAVPAHPGLTVISDGIQTSPLHCEQSKLAHCTTATATPYLHFDQAPAGNRTAAFLHNRQLCAVIGVTQKAVTQFESGMTTATTGGATVTTSTTPTASYLAPSAQAATIIVGHPEGTSGTVQYANDKVDSINLLSPNAGPGCISLPPRSARVFQLILPQSATALSLRPHPGSMGSASVIQLTTTGSANLGTATIPLKQTPVVLETGLEAQTAATATAATMEEAHLQDSTMGELQTSGELMDPHKTPQSDASPLLTLAEWDQVKTLDTRSSPLTLIRLPNGQLAAVPSTVFGGTQVTLAAAPPPPPLPPPPPPLQQPVLQSHGATLVLRYPQHHPGLQKAGDQFDPSQGVVDPTNATTTNLTIVNENYQFQQTPHFQHQQRLVMVSSGSKNTCYTTACDHPNDLGSSSASGNTVATGGSTCVGGGGASGDQMSIPPPSQTPTMTTTFQQTSVAAQPPQLQSPAGALTVLVRGANSQNSLQLLIPQPDGTMVLQPATMQNQFCSRAASAPTSGVSLLPPPPPVPQPQQQRQQNSTTGEFTQPIIQTGYISVPRGDETTSLFHAPTTGICANGQFAAADDATTGTTATTAVNSGFIEFVSTTGVDGSRSILSTGDLSKWIRGGTSTTKVIGGRVSTNQQIFHQQACLDSANSAIIRLPQAASRAPVSHHHQQQQQQQLLFLTPSNDTTTAASTNPHTSFSNVATIVQQATGLEHNRGVWAANSATTGTAATALPNLTPNS